MPLKIFWRNSIKKYLRETKMLDYSSENIQQLIREGKIRICQQKDWRPL